MTSKAMQRVVSSHPDSIRMLVLETDTPHPHTQSEVGTFGDVFNALFRKAGEEHDTRLGLETATRYIVEDDGGSVPRLEDIDTDVHSILITGSVYDAHGEDGWVLKLVDLIQHLWQHRPDIKLAGICFGHQVIARALGATVRPAPSGQWELSHTPIELIHVGQQLFNVPSSQSHIELHEMHIDHVATVPTPEDSNGLLDKDVEVHIWGSTEHTAVQGLYIQKRLFTCQGHVEFDEKMVKRQLERRVKAGSLPNKDANVAHVKAEMKHDGLVVAKAILRFFHGDDDEIR